MSILCPGKTDKQESSSGTPKNMEGMKSKNVFETAIDTMKAREEYNEKLENKKGNERTMIKTVFGCIPGTRPINKPKITPKPIKNKISSILL
jgi:hypothetical protein